MILKCLKLRTRLRYKRRIISTRVVISGSAHSQGLDSMSKHQMPADNSGTKFLIYFLAIVWHTIIYTSTANARVPVRLDYFKERWLEMQDILIRYCNLFKSTSFFFFFSVSQFVCHLMQNILLD